MWNRKVILFFLIKKNLAIYILFFIYEIRIIFKFFDELLITIIYLIVYIIINMIIFQHNREEKSLFTN